MRVLEGNWHRKHPNGVRSVAALWKINKRCGSSPGDGQSRGGGIASRSSPRPERAKQLLDPEKLTAAFAEKEILVEKHSHSLATDYREAAEAMKPDYSLFPTSNLPGPREARVLDILGDSVQGGQPGAKQCKGGE